MPFKMTFDNSSDWDRTASEYAKVPIDEGPVFTVCTRMLAGIDSAYPFSNASAILDIGSGPGTVVTLLFNAIARSIPATAKITSTDFSKGMVDVTKSRRQNELFSPNKDVAGLWSRLHADVMDAQNLDKVASDSVSHVMGSLVYFMLPDPRKGLAEAHRVLSEDGVFACTSWAKVGWIEYTAQAAYAVRPETKAPVSSNSFGL
jgi:ubiquinone/menaquinone biosynthesis C-methylase UbiE